MMTRDPWMFKEQMSTLNIPGTTMLNVNGGIDVLNNARCIVERMEVLMGIPMIAVTDGPNVSTPSAASDDDSLMTPGTVFVLKPDGVSVCVVVSFTGALYVRSSKTSSGCSTYKKIAPLGGIKTYSRDQLTDLLAVVGGHLMEEMSDGVYIYLHTLCGYRYDEDEMEKLVNESTWTPRMLRRSLYDNVDEALDRNLTIRYTFRCLSPRFVHLGCAPTKT
eukprot:GHVR01147628.1.p1 GENE.GHVR01147628.1~~GHVR01147628.1.p1  ORF type:complete len:219 (+),score=27.83 GHVR01147628.1:2894-3550(+)